MAKALFFSLPLYGHVNPSLPLVQELVTRGDDVTYYASDGFRPQIERTGARYRAYRNEYLANMTRLPIQTRSSTVTGLASGILCLSTRS